MALTVATLAFPNFAYIWIRHLMIEMLRLRAYLFTFLITAISRDKGSHQYLFANCFFSQQRKSNPENSLPALVDRGAKDGRMKNADGKRKGGEKAADLSVQDTVLRSRSEQARRTHSDLSSDSHGNHNEGSNRKNAALSANAEYSSEARVNGIQQQPYKLAFYNP